MNDPLSEAIALQAKLDNANETIASLRAELESRSLSAWERVDLETMIQNEAKLYADAHDRWQAAEAEVERLRQELSAERMAHLTHLGESAEGEARLQSKLDAQQKIHHDLYVQFELMRLNYEQAIACKRLARTLEENETRLLAHLNRLRAELLIWKLQRRIDTANSSNCRNPRARIANAQKRIERIMKGQR